MRRGAGELLRAWMLTAQRQGYKLSIDEAGMQRQRAGHCIGRAGRLEHLPK